ncbi:C40 family peptidase [Brevibacillus migulae]|uniref:C40 family peptidase n=1 Tax=Brevibacillus migulae TaxID=1644114 RepID=UPI00106DDEA1|nr:C40 family peptidase [Brevibacillus migulae]
MTKRDWLLKSSMTVMLSTSLLMFAEGGQAALAATNSQDSAKAEQVVSLAKSLVGKDYQSGANGPSQFDAPGLAAYIYGKVGIHVSDSVSALYKAGKAVDKNKLQPGDLLFFTLSSSKTPSYLGIYIGDNKFVYANQGSDEVITKSMSTYYKGKLVGVRRLLDGSASTSTTQPTPSTPSTPPVTTPVENPAAGDEITPVDPTPTPEPAPAPAPVVSKGDKIINAGMKYLGIPYKYGDSRSDKRYMDCSDFTYNTFKDIGIKIPTNSRSQATYVKEHGTPVYDVDKLQKGDLIFMMSYKGSKESSYSGIDPLKQRITHVGIYMGDGKILHTYGSGGVRITKFTNTSWEYRFVMGGRPY